ncbi:MAG: hypothetical protein KBC16_02745 [Candidatus Pacebacteria bacterium]|nr:hypothetical protein [Candidatus Paceibacterota bacterium]
MSVLRANAIDTSRWGKEGPTKTVARLYGEIRDGEAGLAVFKGNLTRFVWRSQAMIFHTDEDGDILFLAEGPQTFATGFVREHDRVISMSEKVRRLKHESYKAGLVRGIREELGIRRVNPRLLSLIREDRTRKASSTSYPGLAVRSRAHVYLWEMHAKHFKPDGYVEVAREKTTTCNWRAWDGPLPAPLK